MPRAETGRLLPRPPIRARTGCSVASAQSWGSLPPLLIIVLLISKEAAAIKGIESEVAGDPDILLVPDLESGNMLAKQLIFLAKADSAGLVLGARVPIILTSRSDSVRLRIASCAVAALAAHARHQSFQSAS